MAKQQLFARHVGRGKRLCVSSERSERVANFMLSGEEMPPVREWLSLFYPSILFSKGSSFLVSTPHNFHICHKVIYLPALSVPVDQS